MFAPTVHAPQMKREVATLLVGPGSSFDEKKTVCQAQQWHLVAWHCG